ncbi:hypothetical protein GJ496_005059 [Pomphorhynchus laevis]|nr:hypothetical protein GJ496_005059 [Pomphorhynchus laevis]
MPRRYIRTSSLLCDSIYYGKKKRFRPDRVLVNASNYHVDIELIDKQYLFNDKNRDVTTCQSMFMNLGKADSMLIREQDTNMNIRRLLCIVDESTDPPKFAFLTGKELKDLQMMFKESKSIENVDKELKLLRIHSSIEINSDLEYR